MGPKKVKKPAQEPHKKKKKAEATAAAESELSAIAPGSFIEGLQQNDGDIRHSTALEEDLLAHTEEKRVQKKPKEQATNPQVKGNKKKQKSTSQNSKKPGPAANTVDRKTTGKRKSAGDDGAAKPAKKQKKKLTEPESGRSSASESQEQADGSLSPQSHRDVFTSDEELEGSWEPSPMKRKVKGFSTRSRTSSSDKSRKSSGSASQPDKGRQRKKVKRSDATPLDVVLDEFLDFFEQYKETVESSAVKKALDHFASNVEEQLTEQISSNKRLKALTRENTKIASAIHTKRQRLLDAKNELIKSERQLWLLQKEQSELEQKSEDLKRSKTFLQNIRELNARYLKHRRKHPDEKETYGASSLPALLIEAKHVQTTELQLKAINNRLENTVKDK